MDSGHSYRTRRTESWLASEIFLTGVSAMKSVMGFGWAMPISSFIERMPRFLHQEGCARFEIVDDAIAMLHDDGAELDGFDTQRQEIHGCLVVHRTAVAGDFDPFRNRLRQGQVGDGGDALTAHPDDDPLVPGCASAPGGMPGWGMSLPG